jgi:hypothetical protein
MYLRDGSGDGADHCGHDVGVLPESSDPAERGDLPAPIFEFVLSLQSVTQELHTAGWHKRYRHRHARARAPILSVGSGAHSPDHAGARTGDRDLGAVPHDRLS